MAKKSSAKKANAKKTAVKKVVKKSAPAKKSVSKAPAKKKAAPVKKTVKKAVKKTAPKKAAPKKVAPKKVVKKAAAKAPAKKTAPPKAAKVSAPVKQHLVKQAAPKKIVDLSNFVTPLDDRVIVQTSGADKMTAGGLYIPDTVADVSGNLHGTVVAVGRGHMSKKGHLRPMDVQVGDNVVFSEYSGAKIKIQNEDLIILRESEVMGVVSK
ncbi:MAG: co-chaperone GroES [Bdellovibrio sp.]|nr:co-chaperone GroES [Bdellovibrio sp.]